MFKARATGPAGSVVVWLGLSYENLKRLKDNQPIIFQTSEVLPERDSKSLIIYRSKESAEIIDRLREMDDSPFEFVFQFCDESLEKIRTHEYTISGDGVTFVILARESESVIVDEFSDFIGPETKVQNL